MNYLRDISVMSAGEMRGDVAEAKLHLKLWIEPLTSSRSLLTDHTQSHLNLDGPVKLRLWDQVTSGPSSLQPLALVCSEPTVQLMVVIRFFIV